MNRLRHLAGWARAETARAWRHVENYEPGPKARLASYVVLVIVLLAISIRTERVARENHQLAKDNKARALRNCHRIETMRGYIRQTVAYNDDAYKVRLLRDGINPESALGKARRTEAARISAGLEKLFRAEAC